MSEKFYITTTLPYVNADPHIGYAWEVVRADAWTRFQRLAGQEVFFNIGTDEHGLKIFQKAKELGLEPQVYCDQQKEKWEALGNLLDLSPYNFIRTTDKNHIEAVWEFWREVKKNGFLYKKHYKAKYCVGCELEKTDSELIKGRCPLHPNREIEVIEEENYFFRFSAFQEKLLELYRNRPDFVVPRKRFNEIIKFVEKGLEDFSVSRLKSKMPWGVPVPDDEEQVIYVWFDALINYISAIGWPKDKEKFTQWWPAIQVAGKDNLRQQSAMWQAMLFAVGLTPSKQIFINSFLTSEGQKMSKSLGNVISPYELVEKYGVDGTRYLLLSLDSFGEDPDISWEALTRKFNADLANDLGNLVSRVLNIIEKNFSGKMKPVIREIDIKKEMEGFEFSRALEKIREKISWANKRVDEAKIWELAKSHPEKAGKILEELLGIIVCVGKKLEAFMPQTSKRILELTQEGKIQKGQPLFPRIKT